ncbi:MAG: NTP transferase domain-containing protein [Pseudomonadota bacterium]
MTDFAAIILAAGKGTRMKSDLHKVLHPIAGKPMLMHLLDSFDALSPSRTVVVVGDRREQIDAALEGRGVATALQDPQHGTAHAALQAKDALAGFSGNILVTFGDVPMVTGATVQKLLDALSGGAKVAVLGFRPDDPLAYGRIIADGDGSVSKMVEFKDASEEERGVNLCNSGLLVAHSDDMWPLLDGVDNNNAQSEYYLPDVATGAIARGDKVVVVECDADEVAGINSRAELAVVEGRWQAARREQAMAEGVTMQAPETVFLMADTQLGRDVTLQPNIVFEDHVTIGPGSTIEANLIIPRYSNVPENTLVTRENMYAFQSQDTPSSQWTGQFELTERARHVLQAGPTAINGLSHIIASLDHRNHNQPPERVLDDEFSNILPELKTLQMRLSELIADIEKGNNSDGALQELQSFYADKVAPWFKHQISQAGKNIDGLVSQSVLFVPTYLILSQLLEPEAFAGILSGLATATAAHAVSSQKDGK